VNIVHVLTRLLKAGSEENTLETCKAQVEAGHCVTLVHGRELDPDVRRRAETICRIEEVPSLVHPISPLGDLRAVIALSRLFRALNADIVHTHQSKAGILGRIAARVAGVNAIIHGVHILPFINVSRRQEIIYVAAERICAALTDAFIDVSPSVRDACIARRIGTADRHFVAYSAMDVLKFRNPAYPADWRELLNVPVGDRPPTAVMLAAFEPRKRQVEFIGALPHAMRSLRDWRVLFAGTGETEAKARQIAIDLGLQERVRFAGFRRDPESIVALADVGVLTSEREGLPRVVVQYAAAGKPTVVSHVPGIGDIVEDGISAIVTPHNDVAAAASATALVLKDLDLRNKLTAGARSIDVEPWSSASMNEAIGRAYARVVRGM
jgi:glycosyltransferase involved in cell wall biosynthesis